MSARHLAIRTAELLGVLVLVIALLPVVAVAGWLARGFAVLVGMLSLLALGAICTVPSVRHRLYRAAGLEGDVHGWLHPRH